MSSSNSPGVPAITPLALWTWGGSGQSTVATGYPPNGQPTKTGLLPQDLKNYVGVPIVIQASPGQPAIPVPDSQLLAWIRWAEDKIEQDTNVRLCQTWIAAPAEKDPIAAANAGLITNGGQQLGVDYDLEEPPYDFHFENAQDDGWMYQKLRWKPVQGPTYADSTGMKNYAYIYPLLNAYFRVFVSWFVTDKDYGLIRLVPATNVQMLPLFAMQITFQGFSNSVPGGLAFQYVAGLTANDLASEYSFMNQLVLALAAVTALGIIQGSLNYGVTEMATTVDGLSQKLAYSAKGPYSGLIDYNLAQIKSLYRTVRTRMGGTSVIML